jgi:hypothetical protein
MKPMLPVLEVHLADGHETHSLSRLQHQTTYRLEHKSLASRLDTPRQQDQTTKTALVPLTPKLDEQDQSAGAATTRPKASSQHRR